MLFFKHRNNAEVKRNFNTSDFNFRTQIALTTTQYKLSIIAFILFIY